MDCFMSFPARFCACSLQPAPPWYKLTIETYGPHNRLHYLAGQCLKCTSYRYNCDSLEENTEFGTLVPCGIWK